MIRMSSSRAVQANNDETAERIQSECDEPLLARMRVFARQRMRVVEGGGGVGKIDPALD